MCPWWLIPTLITSGKFIKGVKGKLSNIDNQVTLIRFCNEMLYEVQVGDKPSFEVLCRTIHIQSISLFLFNFKELGENLNKYILTCNYQVLYTVYRTTSGGPSQTFLKKSNIINHF